MERSAATTPREAGDLYAAITREMVLDAFYDSVCGCLTLYGDDPERFVAEVRHSQERYELQLDEAPWLDD